MAIFARAFLYCKEHGVEYDAMAAKLATIEWHLLSCERAELPVGPTFSTELYKAAQSMWSQLLVVGENRYRVSSSSGDADIAWEKIATSLFKEELEAA